MNNLPTGWSPHYEDEIARPFDDRIHVECLLKRSRPSAASTIEDAGSSSVAKKRHISLLFSKISLYWPLTRTEWNLSILLSQGRSAVYLNDAWHESNSGIKAIWIWRIVMRWQRSQLKCCPLLILVEHLSSWYLINIDSNSSWAFRARAVNCC